MKYITRIAPSPSGPPHIGTIRTAYFNWLAAKATNGQFILRIDDTDLSRIDDKYINQFIDALYWLKINPDRIVKQSDRNDIYQNYSQSLIDYNFAVKDGNRVRLNLYQIPSIKSWNDSISGNIPIKLDNISGFDTMTIIKSDGTPTYHFASVVDDIDMNINFVIRGIDHMTNTAKHVLLYNIIGESLPKFAHVGLIHSDGKKLSKRTNGSSILKYKNDGIDPDAMLNFLARMGWGPTIDDKTTKLLSKNKMIELFLDGGKMKAKSANIDLQKLASFDRKYKAQKLLPNKFVG